jgi:hypothetical protein
MDTSPALFLSDEALQAQALKIPQNLPFDIVVEFDWAEQVYQLRGQWHIGQEPDQGYRIKLPDIDAAFALDWKPRSHGLKACRVPVAHVHALLFDHSFQVLKDGRECFVGMLLETTPSSDARSGTTTWLAWSTPWRKSILCPIRMMSDFVSANLQRVSHRLMG